MSVNAITFLSYSMTMQQQFGQQPLTAATRAKLSALGINTRWIKTESEGRHKLQQAQSEQTNKPSKSERRANQEDAIREQAQDLAKKLNISISNSETLDDIIVKLKAKVQELKTKAGDDFNKKENIAYYETHLEDIINSQMSMIDLNTSMNLTASFNMAYHGLA